MPTESVTLIKGDKIGVETDYRDALPVNMYAVEKKILGAQGYMIEYPGLAQLGTGSGINRGANYNERLNDQYRVSGNKLISVSSTGTTSILGTIPGSSQCRVEDLYSFNTQGIIADGKMFLYSPSSGFNEVTDSDLGNPIDGVWVDGYYFLTDGDFIYHTDLADETAIDPNKFSTAAFMPDPSLGLSITQDNKVMVWGRYTLEYFVNVSTANFAFQRVETRAQKIGIVATHAKCESGSSFYITGGRRREAVGVYSIGVGSAIKVSTREIDKILKQYTEPALADMRMESRTEDNTTFIKVHLPNETLCFNETVAKKFGLEYGWTILKSDVQGDLPYRGINGVLDARSSKWVYGDKRDSKIGIIDNNICTHYGNLAEWILYTPLLELETLSIDEIEIKTMPGHTTAEDATLAISATVDGVTYGQEWWNDYGDPQEYRRRLIFRELGYVDHWIGFKFRGASSSRMAFGLMKVSYS